MRIIVPHTITDSQLIDSNIAEPDTDEPALWASGTTYATDAQVIRNHAIYQAAQTTTGNDPATDTSETYWVKVRATNRWRAFDDVLSGGVVTSSVATITYQIRPTRSLDSIAFFSMNATSVRIRGRLPTGTSDIFDKTYTLSSRDDINTYWAYFFDEFTFKPDVVITGLTIPSGCNVYITITAGAAAEVGEIILGRNTSIGTTVTGTRLGIVDYSLKERDDWGGLYIVSRPVTSTVNFAIRIETETAAEIHKKMKSIASKVCVFFDADGQDDFGTTVPGILRDYELTLETAISEITLEVESLA